MFRRLCHWGPLIAFGIIKLVAGTTVHCTTLWLPCTESLLGTMNAIIFFGFALLTCYNLLCSVVIDPGYVPVRWKPKKREDERCLQFCMACSGFKAPRSHHCRKCKRCIMKMDHHCPWINNCVGHFNHYHFVSFLFFAVCGSIHAFFLLTMTVYKLVTSNMYYVKGLSPPIRLSFTTFSLCIFCIGMALGVFCALSFLLYIQLKSVIRNCTGVEDWILDKADERRSLDPTIPPFVFPYNLGWRENISQVFGSSHNLDGMAWKVKDGCSVYDLTMEQLEQKELKKMRKKPFKVVKKYSGAIFPVVNGFCAFLRPPLSTERRMPLSVDEVISVTRFQKYWLFGEKNKGKSEVREKGWFPRSCAVAITELESYDHESKKKEL